VSDEPPKRSGGRPRAAEPGVVISTWVAASDYDRLIRLAYKHGVSISSVVHTRLRRALRAAERGDRPLDDV